jgi:RecA-family ATPase
MSNYGDGTSGSTAWSNTFRSRLYLEHAKEEVDDDDDEGKGKKKQKSQTERVLTRLKANYSTIGNNLLISYSKGVFQTVAEIVANPKTLADAQAQIVADCEVFLMALDTLNGEGKFVSEVHNASNYAPKLMTGTCGLSKHRLLLAMNALLKANKIERAVMGKTKGRHDREGLRRAQVAAIPSAGPPSTLPSTITIKSSCG